jgi:hypothetical protein
MMKRILVSASFGVRGVPVVSFWLTVGPEAGVTSPYAALDVSPVVSWGPPQVFVLCTASVPGDTE